MSSGDRPQTVLSGLPAMSETGVATEPVKPNTPLLADYRQSGAHFDELLASTGEVRPHYAPLLQTLEHLGAAELQRRWDTCVRLVHEQGISYNVPGDPRSVRPGAAYRPEGLERPWQLDPIPFVLAPQEWPALEAGLIQRATLLNRILVDCYGAQELIRSRGLPPTMVF